MSAQPSNDMTARLVRAGQVFRPSGPIDTQDMFSGRGKQIVEVIGAFGEQGRHAAIFGERGVGKTSLAKTVHEFMPEFIISLRVGCDRTDSFSSIWQKVIDELKAATLRANWPHGEQDATLERAVEFLCYDEVGPDQVRHFLSLLTNIAPTVVFLDEFERVADSATKSLLADTIKMLSDNLVNATIVIVGVADDVDGLIAQHQSIGRSLAQIPMPRMENDEIAGIYEKGFPPLSVSVDPDLLFRLERLPQGIPHFAHRLGLEVARRVILDSRNKATQDDVRFAITSAISSADESLTRAYTDATDSAHKTLYKSVLLACALAPVNAMGYFAPGELRPTLRRITGEVLDIPRYARHLVQFCNERGPVLERRGGEHKWRYRFIDPMMRPYVVMMAVDAGVSEDVLEIAPGPTDSARLFEP